MVDQNLINFLGAIAAAAGASASLGVWISKQFKEQQKGFYIALEAQRVSFDAQLDRQRDSFEEALTKQRETFELKVDAHEKIDQDRHVENVGRFGDLRVILAQMGAGVPPLRKGHS